LMCKSIETARDYFKLNYRAKPTTIFLRIYSTKVGVTSLVVKDLRG
jgi:hypothetical protein